MQKRRRNTQTAPQSKRRQGSDTHQQLVDLDSNPSLTYSAKAPTSQAELHDQTMIFKQEDCDPGAAAPKYHKDDIVEVDQNVEEEDFGIKPEIIRVNRKDNYVTRFWFECCMCEYLLNSATKICNKCPHECCEDCHAKRRLPS
jgi:hypothetical protein